ncbi:hypothetical protein DFH27DRAFT_652942 [Peziza echinospora]|nr:hypothetical protein DFH27DRAFT_652942 [Peziza echinospora]
MPPIRTSKSKSSFSRIEKYNNLNLPDGTHRRKLEKIKTDLITKAKLTNKYHKLKDSSRPEVEAGKKFFLEQLAKAEEEKKAQELIQQAQSAEDDEWKGIEDGDAAKKESGEEKNLIHPSRKQREEEEDKASAEAADADALKRKSQKTGPPRPPRKQSRFAAEQERAEQIKAEREEHVRAMKAREDDMKRRQREREQWSKVANAKTKTGQLKLGKQSGMLLERIKRQMAETT